jgi:NADH:ubiquinone oxidoreductase subunit 5 (subunit L)/multisubunit Na+/H+ antiporter MnhA subunit
VIQAIVFLPLWRLSDRRPVRPRDRRQGRRISSPRALLLIAARSAGLDLLLSWRAAAKRPSCQGPDCAGSSGALQFDWALRVDTLTAVMLVVVNTVSALVHLYSIGYMHDDPHRPRFFAYLSLFTFAMLMLVTADNLVQMFFGWEGVGLASYLLIGFWYKKPSANAAAIKAFVVNRVGDFGFMLGIFGTFVSSVVSIRRRSSRRRTAGRMCASSTR